MTHLNLTAYVHYQMMVCCLNPQCTNPINPETNRVCRNCGTPLIYLLRGRYRPVQPIGQGGFARTYLALDQDRLSARCVIKQFSPYIQGTKSMEKAIHLFNQEAVRLYELGEHPQIPTLLAYFEHEKNLYLVQQFIEGHNLLQEMHRQGAFSEQKIRDILLDILPILSFIHQHQVIHRDITPTNILRRKIDGQLMLIDFGVAKQLNASLPTQAGTRIGTEGYSPLEQFRGGRAFPASDVYSIGATCIHLLTKTRPDYLYDPLEGCWRWREQLQKQGRDVSDRLAHILDTMIKDMVSDRYQSADDVLKVMETSTASLSSPSAYPRPESKPTSSPSSGVGPLSVSRPPSSRPPTSKPGLSKPPSNPPVSRAQSSQPPRSRQPMSRSVPSRPPMSRPPVSGRFSPRSNASSQIYGWRCVNTLTGHSSWVTCVAVNPATPTLASSSLDDTVKVWNLQTGESLFTLRGHTKAVNAIAISPDGKILASASDDYSIKIWNLFSGELIRTLTGHARDVTALAISPDGQYLISGGEDRTLRIWQLETGKLLKTPFGVASIVKSLAISPNSKYFVSVGFDKKIKRWSMQTADLQQEWLAHIGSIHAIAISPNSELIASAGKDRSIRLWNALTGTLMHDLSGHSRDVNAVAFNPDGQTVLSASNDKTLKIWSCDDGRLIATLTDHLDTINAIAFDRSGQLFISGSSDKTIKIWQAT
ncbi:MAG TPA: protein kinase domain-containing protein [Elainellaceae cyanobacterium]